MKKIVDRGYWLTRIEFLRGRRDTTAVAVNRGVDPIQCTRGQIDLPAPGAIADDADLAVEIRQGVPGHFMRSNSISCICGRCRRGRGRYARLRDVP